MAHWGLLTAKDTAEDLGVAVDVIPLVWRPKATQLTPLITYYNPKSEDFKRVMKQSEVPNSGCFYGPEFLVWIPSIKKFASYSMNSKTARNQAPQLLALMGKGATLKIKYIETTNYSWHGPVVTQCSVPLGTPDPELRKEVEEKFCHPEESSVEFDPEKLDGEEGRAR